MNMLPMADESTSLLPRSFTARFLGGVDIAQDRAGSPFGTKRRAGTRRRGPRGRGPTAAIRLASRSDWADVGGLTPGRHREIVARVQASHGAATGVAA